MSIISDYWRYYANVDITKDFKSAIDGIYNCWPKIRYHW